MRAEFFTAASGRFDLPSALDEWVNQYVKILTAGSAGRGRCSIASTAIQPGGQLQPDIPAVTRSPQLGAPGV